MSTKLTPADETGDPLYEAYRDQRPDPGAFAQGVRERIARMNERTNSPAPGLPQLPQRVRWAASLLPPWVVGAVPSGTGIAGKKVGFKLIPAALAMPAIVLVVLVGTFLMGVRSLANAKGENSSGTADLRAVERAWWKRNHRLALAGLAVLVGLALNGHADVFTAFLALSMVLAVLLMGELARARVVRRDRAAWMMASLLLASGGIWFNVSRFLPADPSGYPNWIGGGILLLGAFLCLVAGGGETWRKVGRAIWFPLHKQRYPDPTKNLVLRGVGVLACLTVVLVVTTLGFTTLALLAMEPPSRESVVEYVEGFEAPIDDFVAWRRLTELLDGLAESPGAEPDLTAVTAQVKAKLSGSRSEEALLSARLLFDHGIIDRDCAPEIIALAEEGRSSIDRSPGSLNRRSIGTLHRAGLLSEEERAKALASLKSTWPRADGYSALEQILERIRLLDSVGEDGLVEAYRPLVHEALVAHWRGIDPDSPDAGFTRRANPRDEAYRRLYVVIAESYPLSAAAALMTRFGVPPEIDCVRVRDTVRAGRTFRVSGLLGEDQKLRETLIDLTQVQLEALAPELQTPWSWTLSRRTLLGALLMVILCLLAIRQAPKVEAAE